MAHLASRRTRALTLPVGLALTASLGFLPGTATAAPAQEPTAAVSTDGPKLSYVVNTRAGHGTVKQVRKAIAKAKRHRRDVVRQDRRHRRPLAEPGLRPDDPQGQGRSVGGVHAHQPDRPAGHQGHRGRAAAHRRTGRGRRADAKAYQDPLEPLQWDLPAIKADKAHEKSLGSSKVTVAVIDTGVDDTHPDLAPNFDRAASVNCVSGAPDTTDGAWRPAAGESDHGTHVAGTIAAAKNGVGVTGIAPGVKVSGIKVSTTVASSTPRPSSAASSGPPSTASM